MLYAAGPMRDSLLILHFLGLALGVGTGFAMMRLGMSAKTLTPEERSSFMSRVLVLSKNGSWGLLILIATGVPLWILGGGMSLFRSAGWPFHTKLLLVVVLIALTGVLQATIARLRRAQGSPAAAALAARLPKVGSAMTGVSVLIVITAVLAFH